MKHKNPGQNRFYPERVRHAARPTSLTVTGPQAELPDT